MRGRVTIAATTWVYGDELPSFGYCIISTKYILLNSLIVGVPAIVVRML